MRNDRQRYPNNQSLSWQQDIYIIVLSLSLTDSGFTFQFFAFLNSLCVLSILYKDWYNSISLRSVAAPQNLGHPILPILTYQQHPSLDLSRQKQEEMLQQWEYEVLRTSFEEPIPGHQAELLSAQLWDSHFQCNPPIHLHCSGSSLSL